MSKYCLFLIVIYYLTGGNNSMSRFCKFGKLHVTKGNVDKRSSRAEALRAEKNTRGFLRGKPKEREKKRGSCVADDTAPLSLWMQAESGLALVHPSLPC